LSEVQRRKEEDDRKEGSERKGQVTTREKIPGETENGKNSGDNGGGALA